VILVDASMAHPHGFSPFGLASQEAVVVLSGSSASITEAYSLIKKVSHAFLAQAFPDFGQQGAQSAGCPLDLREYRPGRRQRGIARLDYAGAIPSTKPCARRRNLAARFSSRPRILHRRSPSAILPPTCFTGSAAKASRAGSSISCSNCYT
jgi:hypothetical protein